MLVGSSRGWRGPRFEITIISNACILEQSEVVDTIPTRNGRELGEIWVSKVGTNF